MGNFLTKERKLNNLYEDLSKLYCPICEQKNNNNTFSYVGEIDKSICHNCNKEYSTFLLKRWRSKSV